MVATKRLYLSYHTYPQVTHNMTFFCNRAPICRLNILYIGTDSFISIKTAEGGNRVRLVGLGKSKVCTKWSGALLSALLACSVYLLTLSVLRLAPFPRTQVVRKTQHLHSTWALCFLRWNHTLHCCIVRGSTKKFTPPQNCLKCHF